jgi:hypothetical protein
MCNYSGKWARYPLLGAYFLLNPPFSSVKITSVVIGNNVFMHGKKPLSKLMSLKQKTYEATKVESK